MRKVSIEIAKAFINDKKKTVGNTYTENGEIFLHNNKIAWWESTGKYYSKGGYIEDIENPSSSNSVHLCFSMCGWDTVTTRERLNTLFYELFNGERVYLQQATGNQYIYINNNCMKIDPSKVYVLREIGDDLFLDEPVALAI